MLLGYKKRFVEPIQLGTKVFTMRGKRKIEPKIGETLYMYTGLRTPQCMKISDKEKLISKQKVRIVIGRLKGPSFFLSIKVKGKELTKEQREKFVRFDGFTDQTDFCQYWFANTKSKKEPGKLGKWISAILTSYHWTDLKLEDL